MERKTPIYFLLLAVLLVAHPFTAGAQNKDLVKKDLLHSGNKMYKRAQYAAADSLYTAAVAVDTTYATGWYNLGNSLYLGGENDQAKAAWMRSLLNTAQEDDRADILYNLGGVEMDKKNYAEAIKLYKDALRREPTDEKARYNLALAQELLEDQQNQQDQNQNKDQNKDNQNQNNDQNKDDQNQNNDQNKDDQNQNNDQNKDDQNQNNDQNKDDQNKNNDQNKDDQNKNNDQNNDDQNKNNDQNRDNNQGGGSSPRQNQPQPLSSSDEQMLRAIDRQEQGTQEKVKGQKAGEAVVHSVKDW